LLGERERERERERSGVKVYGQILCMLSQPGFYALQIFC